MDNGPVVKVQDGDASVIPSPAIILMRSPQCCSATLSNRSQVLCDRPAAAKKNRLTRSKKRSRNSPSRSRALTNSSQPLGTVKYAVGEISLRLRKVSANPWAVGLPSSR
ncbi:hypothetical protein ALO79_200350 [Pseudomonas syringae pv. castaneae]|uniref:Uncharacterized protein n=1 Tax=Pseudomonas syringae pv. castaneae TaxID=264450 RepID=A0A0P9PFX0_PSESX|nr:hypothetical protein ALO79_200350 [Pseudomonas syringae pv. castaneae]